MRKRWKQIIALVLALILVCPATYINVAAEETSSDASEETVTPYFDLEFKDGVATDAQGNTTVTSIGTGTVKTKVFEMDGNYYELDAYCADKYVEGDHSYLNVVMNGITTTDEMESWILKENGVTFECYVWVDAVPDSTAYFMGNLMPNGGLSLASRTTTGALNFQMSTTKPENGTYYYSKEFVTAFPDPNYYTDSTSEYYEAAQQYKTFNAGYLTHVVGSYDPETNIMSVYKDGELVGQGIYGTKNMEWGKKATGYITPGELGIGGTPGYLKYCLDSDTDYAIVESRIYSDALTDEQVAAAYTDCVNQVKSGKIVTPEPYFDLELADGVASDAMNNNTVTQIGTGAVGQKIFEMDGKYYVLDAYNADEYVEGDHSYLKLQMKDITTTDQMESWILKEDGVTFECYIWVNELPSGTYYYMGNMISNGGLGLTTRDTKNALNFQMSTTKPENGTYKYDSMFVTAFPSPKKYTDPEHEYYEMAQNEYVTFDAGYLTHVVGTYNPETNMMSFYKNGELVGEGIYGTKNMEWGKASAGYITGGELGVGGVPCTGSALDGGTAYSVVEARIYSDALTAEEVKAVYTNCVSQVLSSTEITIPEDIEVTQLDDLSEYESLTGTAVQEMEGLPDYVYNTNEGVTFGKYGGYVDGIATEMESKDLRTHIFTETDNIAFLSWLKSLESEGWTQYSNNIIEGKNLFATYTKGTQSVYAYYTTNNGEARIILQNNVNLENRAVDNQYESICEPLLTQIRLRSSVQSNGMSYVIRLSDGRFIVIDGGNLEENYADARRIYDVLQEQNQLDEITIAAWIFTHAHSDHINGAYEFLNLYKDENIVIEEVICNFLADYQNYFSSGENAGNYIELKNLYNTLATYWPETKIVTCHTGQEYYFADTKLEFVQAIEDLYPNLSIFTDNSNNTCSVFTMETGGQKILFLGDSHTVENKNILAMWGDYMKSDILQLTHHGKGGGVTALNETIDPDIIMIPASRHLVSKVDGEKNSLYYYQTQWAINNVSGNVKEVIIAGLGRRTISLPYTPAEDAEYINWNQNGYEFEEAEKTEATVPEAYMDLDFQDNALTNGGTADVTFTQNGGTVGTNTVYYKGEAYNVTSYRVEETSGDYILATLNNVLSADDLADLYLNGSTFEMFIALDTPAETLSGLIANAYAGGGGLFLQKPAGTAIFQVGNGTQTGDYYNSNYSYSKLASDRDIANVPAGKNVAHLVGTYNPETNMLQFYHNGVLVTEANYGTKEFKSVDTAGSSNSYNVMGIGVNAGKVSEILSATTAYTILESRIYDTCLTEEQIEAEYWNCIAELTGDQTVKHDWEDTATFEWNDDYSECTATKVCSTSGCTEKLVGTIEYSATDEAYKATATFADGTTYEDVVAKYAVTVLDGSASKEFAAAGEKITLTVGTAPEGKQFKEWVTSPSVAIENNTFTMPAEAVTISAAWRQIPMEVPENVKDITKDNVQLSDEENLNDALELLTNDLDTYGDEYTAEEIEALEDAIDTIEDALKAIENAETVAAKIDALPDEVALEDEALIDAVSEAYEALTAHEKTLVDAAKLEKAKADLAELKSEKAVKEVEEKINALPDEITLEDEEAIKDAEEAYNKLTETEKAMVNEDAVKKLTNAKNALQALKDAQKEESDKDNVSTGDYTTIVPYGGLMILFAGIAVIILNNKRRDRA